MENGAQTTNEAFLAAYDELSDVIFRHCYYRVFDRELALDLTQECFMKTWASMADGTKIDNMKAFLYRVARNLVIDHSRKKKELSLERLMEDGFEPSARDSGARPALEADTVLLLARLDALEPAHRDVLTMRFLEGLGPKEIAALTGDTENAISVRLNRAMGKLRALHDPQPS